MKRSGFTMIELIFVIVILGILAAVAIPKLAATRDDAKVAKGSNELATLISDIGAYYTSKGEMGEMQLMTNVFPGDGTDFNLTGETVTYEGAFTLTSVSTTNADPADGVNLLYTSSGATNVQKGIARAAYKLLGQAQGFDGSADANMTHTFGGSAVAW